MTRFRVLLGLLLALVIACASAQEFAPVPPLQTRVTDTIGMLTANQRAALENVLKEYEARTGSQIAVLLIGSTAPEAIEQYSIRVTDAWQLGRKGIDDGVLLVVAKDNPPALRRLRIEAGRGVQGSLTDAQSKRILQDVIAPHFRQNDFYGGLVAGVSAIAGLLDKENFPAPQGTGEAQQDTDGFPFGVFLFFLFAIMLLSRSRRSRRRAFRPHGWGGVASGVILGHALGELGRHGRGGGFGGGGFGGFSGGGGGFDGGGASGDW